MIGEGARRPSAGALVGAAFCLLVVAYMVTPMLLMVVSSFGNGQYLAFPPPGLSLEWYRGFLGDARWTGALLSSTGVALVVAAVDVVLAGMAAYALERVPIPGARGIAMLCILPAMVPVISYTVAITGAFARWRFPHGWVRLIVAQAVLGFPYAFLILRAGVAGLDVGVEDAARTLGARPLRVAGAIILPLMKWHLAFAALCAFVVSFTEPVTAIFLTSGEAPTLPRKTWEGLRYGIDPRTVVGAAMLVYVLLLAAGAVAGIRSLSEWRR